ncbi:MAG TPA: hypothetical protein VF193_00875 [Steroidobacter sp.]
MLTHYIQDSANPEWLLLSAELEHCDTDICLELRNGRWVIDGVVEVDHFQRALDLLRDCA